MHISFLVADDISGILDVLERGHFKSIQKQLDAKKAGIQLSIQRAMNGVQAAIEYLLSPSNIVLMDYSMPGGNGDRAILNILSINPNAIIYMHSNTDIKVIRDALKKLQENEHNPKWKQIDTSSVNFEFLSKTCKKSEICDLIIPFILKEIEVKKIELKDIDDLSDKSALTKIALTDLISKVSIVESISAEFKIEESKPPRVPESPLHSPELTADSPSPSSVSTVAKGSVAARGSLSLSDTEITPTNTKRRLRAHPKAKFREANERKKAGIDTLTNIVELETPKIAGASTHINAVEVAIPASGEARIQADVVEVAKPVMREARIPADIVEVAKPTMVDVGIQTGLLEVSRVDVGIQTVLIEVSSSVSVDSVRHNERPASEFHFRPAFFSPMNSPKQPSPQLQSITRVKLESPEFSGNKSSIRTFFPSPGLSSQRHKGKDTDVQQELNRQSTKSAFTDKHKEEEPKPTRRWYQCGEAV